MYRKTGLRCGNWYDYTICPNVLGRNMCRKAKAWLAFLALSVIIVERLCFCTVQLQTAHERTEGLMKLQKLGEGIIYGSAAPKKGDRSSYMPYFCEMDDGTILAATSIGSCFDAPDSKTNILRSTDGGNTFGEFAGAPFDFSDEAYPADGSMKVTNAGGNHVIAIGYGFVRNHGDVGPANVETNGLLDCPAFFAESFDGGKTFTKCRRVNTAWGPHAEASAPLTILANGDYVTPIAAMQDWEGNFTAPMCGRLLRSTDQGKTWNDDTVIMDFGPDTTVWEQRLAVTDSGKLVDIAWVENLKTGELHNNQIAISTDNGKTFGPAIDTGVHGQASGICALGGERVLTLHSMRRHVERYGVLACIVNLENGKWEVESSEYVWEPQFAMTQTTGNLGVFSMLRFGQPSAVKLSDGTILYTQWLMENDVCRTIWQRFRLVD